MASASSADKPRSMSFENTSAKFTVDMSASEAMSATRLEPGSSPMWASSADASRTTLAILALSPGFLASIGDQFVYQAVAAGNQLPGQSLRVRARRFGAHQM